MPTDRTLLLRSPASIGHRLGLLYGPSVFGVTAASVALPEVVRALATTPAAATWVLTAHALALGIGTAVFGRLSDRLGPRRTLAIGSTVLGLGAIIVVLAPGIGLAIAGRVLLAAGSGAMASAALAIAAGQPAEQRRRTVAGFGATLAIFTAAATLVGGVVTALAGWRLTLILPVLSLIIVPVALRLAGRAPAPGPSAVTGLDPVGAGLVIIVSTAVTVLVQVSRLALPAGVAVVIGIAGLLAAVGLLEWRRRVPDGFVAAEITGAPGFGRLAAIGAATCGGLFATVALVPRVLVQLHGMSVLEVGLALLPGAALGAILSFVAGRPSDQRRVAGLLVVVATATGLLFVGIAVLGLSGRGAIGLIMLIVAVAAIFASFAIMQVIATARLSASLPTGRRGAGLGLANLAFFAGGALGSALVGALADVIGFDPTLGLIGSLPLTAAAMTLRFAR